MTKTLKSDQVINDKYQVTKCDCIPYMLEEMNPNSVDMMITSVPFPSLFSYTDKESDLGNSEDLHGEAKVHFGYFFRGLARVMKPGRVALVHSMQIPGLTNNGIKGAFDFRGFLIRIAIRSGLEYHYDWLISKNPQALQNGSRVLTPRGWSTIESLVIGSRVIGSDGKPTEVKGVYPQGMRPIFKVTTSDGGSVNCDGRHLWSIMTAAEIAKDVPTLKTVETQFMIDHGLFTDGGSPRFYVPVMSSPATMETNDSDLPLDPYLMGVLLGKGMLSSRSTVGMCVPSWIADHVKVPQGTTIRKLEESQRGWDVASYHFGHPEWHRNDMLEIIRDLGLSGCRAWEKFIPESYLNSSEHARRELIAGLIDTYGGNKTTGGIKYHSTSRRLAEGFRQVIESLGGMCTLIPRKGGKYESRGQEKQGREIFELTPRLRDGKCPFRLPRKVEKWIPPTYGLRRAIVSIEPIGFHPATCITVAAPDGLFVTENCIVTHNSQAIRTHSHSLLFVTLERDRAKTRGAFGDSLIKFVKPGINEVPIDSDEISRNQWIDWAEACWYNIDEQDTLNTKAAKSKDDTRHICPLQLGVIDRGVKLYTNPGEVVFDPFSGIGSSGVVAIKNGRRYHGTELKQEYYDASIKNLNSAILLSKEKSESLFDSLEVP